MFRVPKEDIMRTTNNEWLEIEYREVEDDEELATGFEYRESFYELDNFMRIDDPEIDGVMTLCNTCALGVKIADSGDAVQVYELS
jgi:hypothetical protein